MNGVFLNIQVEMLTRRITIPVPESLARTLNPRERLLTIAYRKCLAMLCTRIPYRTACMVFNELSTRNTDGEKVPLRTFVDDFCREGMAVYRSKNALATEILNANQFDPQTLKYMGESWPEEWKQPDDYLFNVTGNNPLPQLAPEFDLNAEAAEFTSPELFDDLETTQKDTTSQKELKEVAKRIYSQPDTREIVVRKARRSSRYEMEEKDMKWALNGFVDWLNNETSIDECKILKTWTMEKGSKNTVHIGIDAVYVDKQCSTHGETVKSELKEHKQRIAHWNIAIEFDGIRYCVTGNIRLDAFQKLFAVLLSNELMSRYFVFFADGETEIFNDVNAYFADCQKTLLLDWYHLQEKVYQKMSSAIKHDMKPDPRSVAKAKKEGKTPDSKNVKNTACSNLYARLVVSILWVGNVDEAIRYLKNISPDDIKNPDAINSLIGYLERKRDWIPCYALRKRAGLRNASNGSEGINHILVAKRQKVDGMSWSDEGSYSASNLSTLYANEEADLWFSEGKTTFTVPMDKRIEGINSIKYQNHARMNEAKKAEIIN